MSDEESEGLAVGRAWLKARLAAGMVGFCSFPTDPGKLLDPVQNHLEGQGRGPGREVFLPRKGAICPESTHQQLPEGTFLGTLVMNTGWVHPGPGNRGTLTQSMSFEFHLFLDHIL